MSTQQNNFPRRKRLGMTRGLMLRRKVIAGIAAILMGVSLVFSGSASAQDQEFAGAWRGKFGDGGFELVLQQSGAQVTGQLNINSVIYVVKEGIADAKTLRFRIVRPRSPLPNNPILPDEVLGTGELVMDEGGKSFTGKILNADVSGTRIAGGGGEAQAQEKPAPSGEMTTLTGQIRWLKAMGTTPLTRNNPNSNRNQCASFYVRALDPDNNNKVVAFTEALEWGGERDGWSDYACKYEMTVPANRRLVINAGIGDPLSLPKGGDPIAAAINSVYKPRFYFKPSSKEVTIANKMYLAFELLYYPGVYKK